MSISIQGLILEEMQKQTALLQELVKQSTKVKSTRAVKSVKKDK